VSGGARLREKAVAGGRLLIVCGLALLAAACAATPERACATGEKAVVSDALYFGTEMPGATVTPDDWARFVDTVATPRFPQGLTVWQASGQWRSADGSIVREGSYVLTLVHAGDPSSDNAVREIVDRYKSQFRQEAVLRVRTIACASL
jgi:uncharacterized protein DUF3574